MTQVKTRLAEGGQIVIPAEYLQVLGIQIGDEVILLLEDGVLRIVTPEQAIKHTQELVRRYIPEGRSLSDELIAERRMENEE